MRYRIRSSQLRTQIIVFGSFALLCCAALLTGRVERTEKKFSMSMLPGEILQLASALFDKSSAEVLRNIQVPQEIFSLGHKILLTQHRGDDSIPRLLTEFSGDSGRDTYGIHEIRSRTPLILDVGGNIGFISILTQRLHPHSQVIVFEPSPLTYFFLRLNLIINDIHLITSEELQSRPRVPGVYPVFGGLGGREPVEFVSMSDPDRVKRQSQNGILDLTRKGVIPVYNFRIFLSNHGLSGRVFDLVKLDCECCEYGLIPESRDFLRDKSSVLSLTGEIHGCGHVSARAEKETIQILQERGCRFPERNFQVSGRFYETANLNDYCPH